MPFWLNRISPTVNVRIRRPRPWRKSGRCSGSNTLIVGSITKFGLENKDMKIGGSGWGGGRFGLGEVGKSKGKANVAITARVIDTSTGEIMASAKGDGTSSRSGLLLGGGGGGGAGGIGEVSMGSSDFQDTILGRLPSRPSRRPSRRSWRRRCGLPTLRTEDRQTTQAQGSRLMAQGGKEP